MNKILLDGKRTALNYRNIDNTIEVVSNSIMDLINTDGNVNLKIYIKNGATLILNIFDYTYGKTINIYVETSDDSKFKLYNSFITNGEYKLNIDTNLYGDNIENEVNIRGINSKEGNTKIVMNGQIAGETKNNVLSEYARIINNGNKTNVLVPNLIVNTNDVIANHGVSIGNFSEDQIFYLMSKGIEKYKARKVLEDGFILSIMDDKNRELIKNILIGR